MRPRISLAVPAALLLLLGTLAAHSAVLAREAPVDEQTRITVLNALKAFERDDMQPRCGCFAGPPTAAMPSRSGILASSIWRGWESRRNLRKGSPGSKERMGRVTWMPDTSWRSPI